MNTKDYSLLMKLSIFTKKMQILLSFYRPYFVSILLSPAEDFEGILLWRCPSSFRPSGRLWITESWPKFSLDILYYLYIQHLQYINSYIQYNCIGKGFGHKFCSTCEVTCLLPLTKWKGVSCLQRSEESTGYGTQVDP